MFEDWAKSYIFKNLKPKISPHENIKKDDTKNQIWIRNQEVLDSLVIKDKISKSSNNCKLKKRKKPTFCKKFSSILKDFFSNK